MTLGREADDDSAEDNEHSENTLSDYNIAVLIVGLGGKENIISTDHFATRLRLVLNNTKNIDEKKFKSTGTLATRVIDDKNVQFVHDELKENI